MRISDWSSDVCSSDLSAAQSTASVSALSKAVAEQRERVIEARNNRGEIALLQGDVDNLKRTYEQIVSRRAQLGIMGEGIQTNVAILSAATAPDRSEEHTSELQSLMRISYAVF